MGPMMQIRILATHLPGSTCPGYRGIHVGVQRKRRPTEIMGLTSAGADAAMWTLNDCKALPGADGIDITGPYIEGRPGGRFIYLSWNTVDGDELTMFRRAKLWLDGAGEETLKQGVVKGVLTARLALTDAKGMPLCAAVRPPLISWTAGF